MIKLLKLLGFAAVLAFVPQAGRTEGARKSQQPPARAVQPRQVPDPALDIRGNAALGGNNANSAYGSNSANENANGRAGGGFGGN